MLGVSVAEKIGQNKKDLEVELVVILYRLTLISRVKFEQRIKGNEEEKKAGMFMERMFQSERTTS